MDYNLILDKTEELNTVNASLKSIQDTVEEYGAYIIPRITIRDSYKEVVTKVGQLVSLVESIKAAKDLTEQVSKVVAINTDKSIGCGSDSPCDGCSSDCDGCYSDCDGCYSDCSSDTCSSDGCYSDCGSDCDGCYSDCYSDCGSDCDGCYSDCGSDWA